MSDLFDQSALASRAEALVEAARKAGADAADALATRSVSLGTQVRHGDLEEMERSETDVLGLRVLVGQRQATVSTRDPEGTGFASLAERAVAMARSAPADPYAGLATADLYAHDLPDLDLLDRTEVSAEELVARAKAAEEAGLSVAGVTNSGGASASWSLSGIVLATSEGFSGRHMGSRHSVSFQAVAGTGTAMERDYDYTVAAYMDDLEDAATIGRRAGERAVKRLGPRKIETGRLPVVFDPRVATGLVGSVAGALNGSAIARGSTFLGRSLGQKILPDDVTIVDDATIRRGLRSHPFDAEGIAPRRLALVGGAS
ncbi:TldE protein, part of TldE/TldD proteolytic complex [Lutibaculum baratangense AMV1]|uniref:TldE protein, part of TldE/TldD proteolytic complex n=1 Tax=Lutibaculum baratangense AMV1 TaxID=631454 RepID=V4RP43_9HYPH|nr:TldE protein, part of TldE/TldD proteolytic complex [Lutibaculum baratangense AMV1]